MRKRFRIPFIALLCACAPLAQAKPIAFADGYTVMGEYGAGTMIEAQAFYAPKSWLSVGAGYLKLMAESDAFEREIPYVRANYLVKRWNQPGAQANVFAYAGAGAATSSDYEGTKAAYNAGLQLDRESLRWYTSFKTDYQASSAFSHRIDTLQVGVAPYKHDYTRLATWIVVQARNYTGGLYDGIEVAALLRFFRGPVWLEAGGTADGKLQAMLMFNY